jgi:TRAP-type C4-dicarboxylate transport system permease small subunit
VLVRLTETARRLAEGVSVALFVGVFAVSLAGVVARYVFNRPIIAGDELAMILLVWSVFLTDALVTRDRDHVAFDIVWDLASPGVRRAMLVVQGVLFAALFAAALPTVLDYVAFLWRERTSALQWRLDVVYACFVLYIAMLVVRLAAKAARAAGRGWKGEVAEANVAQTTNVIG